MIKLVVFDFDGTIVDTKRLFYYSIRRWIKKNTDNFSERRFRKFFGFKLTLIMKSMKARNQDEIRKGVHEDLMKNIKKIRYSKDVRYIRDIKKRKIILSNTMTWTIKNILRILKLRIFKEIYGGENFDEKEEFLKKFIKKNKLKGNEVIYIGDMVKDVKVARKAGCISIVISHKISWNSRNELLKAKPDYIIEDFRDLEKIISDIQ